MRGFTLHQNSTQSQPNQSTQSPHQIQLSPRPTTLPPPIHTRYFAIPPPIKAPCIALRSSRRGMGSNRMDGELEKHDRCQDTSTNRHKPTRLRKKERRLDRLPCMQPIQNSTASFLWIRERRGVQGEAVSDRNRRALSTNTLQIGGIYTASMLTDLQQIRTVLPYQCIEQACRRHLQCVGSVATEGEEETRRTLSSAEGSKLYRFGGIQKILVNVCYSTSVY